MAKKSNKNKPLNIRAQDLTIRQLLSGIILVCLIVTIIGSSIAGAQTITIIYRCFIVYAILFIIASIIKRYWVSMNQLRQDNAKEHRR